MVRLGKDGRIHGVDTEQKPKFYKTPATTIESANTPFTPQETTCRKYVAVATGITPTSFKTDGGNARLAVCALPTMRFGGRRSNRRPPNWPKKHSQEREDEFPLYL
jgi:hypothetical protein